MKNKHCNKKLDVPVITSNGITFFERAKVRCGWWKADGEKYRCEECKINFSDTNLELDKTLIGFVL